MECHLLRQNPANGAHVSGILIHVQPATPRVHALGWKKFIHIQETDRPKRLRKIQINIYKKNNLIFIKYSILAQPGSKNVITPSYTVLRPHVNVHTCPGATGTRSHSQRAAVAKHILVEHRV